MNPTPDQYDEMLVAVEEQRLVYECSASLHEEKLNKLRLLIQRTK